MNLWDGIVNFVTKTIPWQVMFGLFIATGVLLFFSARLGIYEWAHPYRGPEITVFIFSGAVLLATSRIFPWITERVCHAKVRGRGMKYMHTLNPEEKKICKHFVDTDGSPLPHNPANGAIASLLDSGILWRPEQGFKDWLYEFNIRPWALEYLKKKPELLHGAKQ